jgi:hypothetical protein
MLLLVHPTPLHPRTRDSYWWSRSLPESYRRRETHQYEILRADANAAKYQGESKDWILACEKQLAEIIS